MDIVVKSFLAATDVKMRIEGLTILRGESSHGKSSTFKALVAAMTNRFSPRQVSWGADHAYVAIRFGGKDSPVLKVLRRREGSPDMELAGRKFTKLGRDVPKEVQEFCNMGVLEVGQDRYYLNWFPQFQKPLLLDFSQKRVAEILSSSTSMTDYNLVWKYFLRRRDELNGAFERLSVMEAASKEKLSGLRAKRAAYKPFEDELRALYITYKDCLQGSADLAALRGSIMTYWYHRKRSELLTAWSGLLGGLSEVQVLVEAGLSASVQMQEWQNLRARTALHVEMQSGLSELQTMQGALDGCRGMSAGLGEMEFLGARLYELGALQTLYSELGDLPARIESLSGLRSSLSEYDILRARVAPGVELSACYAELVRMGQDVASYHASVSSLQGLVSKLEQWALLKSRIDSNEALLGEGVCPYCGSKIDNQMNTEEIVRKQKELEAQINADRTRMAVLESEIKKSAATLNVEPKREALDAKIAELQAMAAQKEQEINVVLQKVQALEESYRAAQMQSQANPTLADVPVRPVGQPTGNVVMNVPAASDADFDGM